MSGWIGVDLDGTLAEYNGWQGAEHIGAPVPAMVERVTRWLEQGHEVRIFTARVWPITQLITPEDSIHVAPHLPPALLVQPAEVAATAAIAIRAWCLQHFRQILPITCVKDYGMVELYDDRAVQVRPNTGELVGQSDVQYVRADVVRAEVGRLRQELENAKDDYMRLLREKQAGFLSAAAERERCAKLCEAQAGRAPLDEYDQAAINCAAAIRGA